MKKNTMVRAVCRTARARLPIAAFVVLLLTLMALAGCASVSSWLAEALKGPYKGQETELSRKFLDGANDILTQNADGLPETQFKALFQRKFPGVTVMPQPVQTLTNNASSAVRFVYEKRGYIMEVTNIPRIQGKKEYIYWVAATSCKDMTPPEKK